MKLKLPNWGSLCNDNLLINSDYKSGIINQLKKSSYTANNDDTRSYGVDLNYLLYMASMSVNDGYLTVTLPNANSEYGWITNNYVKSIENICIALKLKNDPKIYTVVFENVKGTIASQGTKATKDIYANITVNIGNYNDRLSVYFMKKSTLSEQLNIEFVKCEFGKYFTGMPLWTKQIELQKILPYFEVMRFVSWSTFSTAYVITTNNNTSFVVQPSVKKNSPPSTIINGQIKILFYNTWYDCTNIYSDQNTEDICRIAVSYDNSASRQNGTSCPIALIGDDCYIVFDSLNY